MTKQTKYPDFITHKTVDRNYVTTKLDILEMNSENEKIKLFVKKYPEFVVNSVKARSFYISGDIKIDVARIKEMVVLSSERASTYSQYSDLHKEWTSILMTDSGKMVGDTLIDAGIDDGTIY